MNDEAMKGRLGSHEWQGGSGLAESGAHDPGGRLHPRDARNSRPHVPGSPVPTSPQTVT